jgi:hypothetical protein
MNTSQTHRSEKSDDYDLIIPEVLKSLRRHRRIGVHTTFLQKLSLTYYTHNRR